MLVGAAAEQPGTAQESTLLNTQGPWQLGGGALGHLGKRGLLQSQPGSYGEATAHSTSPPVSHMKLFLGEREREHASEVGVNIWAWQMRCRPREGGASVVLDLPETKV